MKGRNRVCTGKQQHETEALATAHLMALVARGATRSSLKAYKCRYCGTWHVGHRPGSGGRRP